MSLLTLTDVSKRFDDVTAVDGLTFSVDRGEVIGFLGPNGAGKSTTMRMITQYLEPDEGQVLLDEQPLVEAGREAKRRIGYLPENNPLYVDMLVGEYLAFVARLRGLEAQQARRAIDEAVAATGIGHVFFRPIGELSKGYRQRVGLAQAILHRPDLLVLDEPTEGLDPNQRVEIRRLITELGKDRTVMLSTHVMGEVQHTCSRILVIHEGKIVADGPVDRLLAQAAGQSHIGIEVKGDGVEAALRAVDGVVAVEPRNAPAGRVAATVVTKGEDLRPVLFQLVADRGWTLYELHAETRDLEDVFRQLTARGGSQ
jgi:gliding motility-associated transport system ATP-binding protein